MQIYNTQYTGKVKKNNFVFLYFLFPSMLP